jgi:hypothetical protein
MQSERGATSFLTVIFLSLILSVIAVGFVRLAINEQRQSVDDELSTRALYAAESGIEDGKRALDLWQRGVYTNENQLNGDNCDEPADIAGNTFDKTLSAELATEYSCLLIVTDLPDFQANIDQWDSVQIPLTPADGGVFDEIRIQWHKVGDTFDGTTAIPRAAGSNDLPTAPAWGDTPALLKAFFFSHDGPEPTSNSDFEYEGTFLNPTTSTSGSSSIYSSDVAKNIKNVSCDMSVLEGEYACEVTISGFNAGVFNSSNRQNYLRLQPLYRSSTYVRVELLRGGNATDMTDAQAAVDATGRAGDVTRRIEVRVGLTPNSFPFPDLAILSGDSICKNFAITNDTSDFVAINGNILPTTCTTVGP